MVALLERRGEDRLAAPEQDPRDPVQVLGLAAVLAAEFVDAACGVNNLLLAGVERVATGADVHRQGFTAERRPGLKRVPAAAGHGDVAVSGMSFGFHGVFWRYL